MKKEEAKEIYKAIVKRVNQVDVNSHATDSAALLAISVGAMVLIILEEHIE